MRVSEFFSGLFLFFIFRKFFMHYLFFPSFFCQLSGKDVKIQYVCRSTESPTVQNMLDKNNKIQKK
jgi:hypothetical protein